MFDIGKKIQFVLLKKDAAMICAILCALHIVLAPFFFYFEYDFVTRYHIYAALLYLVMILLSKAIPGLYLFTLATFETMTWSYIMLYQFKDDCGIFIITLSFLGYLFKIVITSRKKTTSTILPVTIMLLHVFAVQLIEFFLSNQKINFPLSFYSIHYTIICSGTALLLIFICYTIQINIRRFTKKSKTKSAFLIYSANHDSLTKILNRRKIIQKMNEFATNESYSSTTFSVSIFDIDGFKKINDTYGHDCGDVILRGLADLIHRSLPEHTLLARWGGEEFIILFVGISNNPKEVLEDIRERVLDHSFKYLNKAIRISITLGLSKPDKSYNFSKMLIEADENLIKGKRNGKNCVVTSEDNL